MVIYFYIFILSFFHLSSLALDNLTQKLEKLSIKPRNSLIAAPLTKIAAFAIARFERQGLISSDDINKIPQEHQDQIIFFKKYKNLNKALVDCVRNHKLSDNIPHLLALGADPNHQISKAKISEPLLTFAIGSNNLSGFKTLLRHPAININAADQFGQTAFMRAIYIHKFRFIKKLIKAGADVNACRNTNEPHIKLSLLMHAILGAGEYKGNKLETLEFVKNGGQIGKEDKEGYLETIKLLLEKGANVNYQSSENSPNALIYSIFFKLPHTIQLLIQYKVNVNQTIKGQKPLGAAEHFVKDQAITKMLKDAGAIFP